ncbi:MAG: ABC transporter permease [Treponema sp.]|jgi:putative ABC transport system permease protein|nr:ABC transporter permease [Treponema sp.]MBQ1971143.1 ABC transporter permease [Treponema sp.]MBQ5632858.1 ABC transporter permease [Treponema sp.]MBQ5645646.1 ABC transporter permease [Treponema sp.]MBQ5847683.1 ABC transporter permease [Treponema sp.]
MSILLAMEGAISQGILWGLMTLGVYLTFRILNVADMTVDGSFAAGGAVTAILITKGMNPILSLLFVFITGLITGLATGLMNTKLKINILLASILSQIALYSINIRIMGKANTPLIGMPTMMRNLVDLTGGRLTTTQASLIIGLVIVTLIIVAMYWFFGTEIGSAIRATGNNEHMVRALGVNTDTTKILGLMISNGMVALSGALVAQSQGYADVGMGTGTIVIGLASIIIGEVIFGQRFGFWYVLLSAVFGSIIYRIIVAVVLQLGLKSTDLKLLTAVIVAAALSVPVVKAKIQRKRRSLPGMNVNEEENTRHSFVGKKHDDSSKM